MASSLASSPRPTAPGVSITHMSPATVSSIRRKPKVTYQSPSALLPADLRIEGSASSISRAAALSLKLAGGPKPGVSKPPTNEKHGVIKRKKYPMGPPLPLYHPLGRLALSLPELDPSTMNLPTPLPIDGSARRSSARARRPAAKLRDTDEVDDTASSSGAREPKETQIRDKPVGAPRKKRGPAPGGSTGGAKRKRKEMDDGDATYPAKRTTRVPRGVGRGATDEPSEEVSTPMPVMEVDADEGKDKKPERRSTRSRSGLRRRDSSASEATTVSVVGGKRRSVEAMDVDAEKEGNDGKGSKSQEEGELSEGAPVPP